MWNLGLSPGYISGRDVCFLLKLYRLVYKGHVERAEHWAQE